MKYGLIIEGGSRKGMFSAGIIDTLLQEGIEFQYVAGVSAGAHGAINYVSGQLGRTKLSLTPTKIRHNQKANNIRDGIYHEYFHMNYKYAYSPSTPFDFDAFFASNKECEIGVTCAETGKITFFSERKIEQKLLDYLAASCALPMLFPLVEIDGQHYGDGCITDSIPYDRAFEKGCDKVVVVSTKKLGKAPTDFSKLKFVLAPLYKRRFPELYKAMLARTKTYDRQLAQMQKLEAEGKVLVIRPDEMYCSAFETDPEKLEIGYQHGLSVGKRELDKLKSFLSE